MCNNILDWAIMFGVTCVIVGMGLFFLGAGFMILRDVFFERW